MQRTFVVQMLPPVDRLEGRVEHVVTGRAARFSSLEELAAFFRAFDGSDPTERKGTSDD